MACYPGQPPLQVTSVLPEGKMETEHHHNLEEYTFNSNLRPQSTQSIAKWLEDNYHYEEGICLPRSTIYDHYVDHCTRENLQPVNAASFGKIIRQQYPSLTTRRLGTRGQSKYHYFGLGIKPTSRYYTADYLEKQLGQGTTRKEPDMKKTHAYYASKEKPSAVLPPFPNVNIMELPSDISKDKLHTFMVMYRAHCQRILDSVVRATFNEVQNFLYHFWQGMPSHLHPILATDIVTDLIAVCDTTLYKAISSVCITTPLQSIPDNVVQEVHHFASSLKSWLEAALKGLPDSLKDIKYQIAAVFKKSLQRQHSLIHLADATRNALHGDDPLDQLAEDWATLDIQNILAHTFFAVQPLNLSDQCALLVPELLEEFSQVLSEQKTSVEDFVVWVEKMVERCIHKVTVVGNRQEVSRTFLLTWKFFTSKIVRELTLMSAPSFGTFHLIHMLIDDYIIHSLESMMEAEQEKEFTQRIHTLESGGAKVTSDNNKSVSTMSVSLQSSATSEVPLIAEPPSAFTFTPDLSSPSQRSSDEVTTPEQPFSNILSPPLHSLQPDDTLRGSSTTLSSIIQQTGRGGIEGQMEPASLQTLITSHGIGGYNNIVPQSTAQESLSQRHSLQESLVLSNSSSSLNMATSEVQMQENSRLPASSVKFSRHQDPSMSLSFVPSQPHPPVQANISSFSLPALTLPPHLQNDHHSLSFDSSSQTLNCLLGDSSAQSRNLSQLLIPQKDLSPQQNVCVATTSHNETIYSTTANLPRVIPPMPVSLPHSIMASGNLPGGLANPSTLPLFPGMPNMYSYPYPNSLQPLPPQSGSSNLPPFPPQGLVSRYPTPYVTPSLYGGSQPPITNTNYNR